jgi:hypothetical protein
MTMSNFQTSESLLAKLAFVGNENVILLSKTSYDEAELVDKILLSGEAENLQLIAIQLATKGWGNKELGKFCNIEGQEIDIKTKLQACGFKLFQPEGQKLSKGDLTVGRLIRVFRFHISLYLKETGVKSFLILKYGTPSYRKWYEIFPFAEYFIEDQESIAELTACYTEMDELNETTFVDRLTSVFRARQVTV